jgi:ADP-heptose:LPS heptosyltransferase
MTESVLLLRALGLGDFLTGVPAYRAVRRAFPGHRVVLAAPAVFTELASLTGAVDEVLPTGELAPIRWSGPPPELAIDLHGRGLASHRLVAALRPRDLIVFGGPHGGGFAGPAWHPDEHEVARWCRLCQESGIPADPGDLRLSGPGRPCGTRAAAAPTIIHPGAASGSRRWPAARFAAVARQLAGTGHQVWLTGSAAERGLAGLVARQAGLPDDRVLAGTTSLRGLSALVASARLVISGDTGVAHLASAHARPSVTLFGPVPPAEWGPPVHPRHQVLWRAGPGYRGDPHGIRPDPALTASTVADVLGAACRALRAVRSTGPRAGSRAP